MVLWFDCIGMLSDSVDVLFDDGFYLVGLDWGLYLFNVFGGV